VYRCGGDVCVRRRDVSLALQS